MQIFTLRYNLEFRKLTLYGITRPQSIRKSKQISGQTILSSPHNLELNSNLREIATFQWLKIALYMHGPSCQRYRYSLTLYATLITCQIPAPGRGGGGLDQYLGVGELLRV